MTDDATRALIAEAKGHKLATFCNCEQGGHNDNDGKCPAPLRVCGACTGVVTWEDEVTPWPCLVTKLAAALEAATAKAEAETEWEYGVEWHAPGELVFMADAMGSCERAYEFMLWNIHGGTIMRRAKAPEPNLNPWVPVASEQTGDKPDDQAPN